MAENIYSNDQKKLVKRLKDARIEAGLRQEEVAEKVGKTQSYISKTESGQRKIDVMQLKEFAKIYRKEIEFFIK
jgi:transcriptional regulator with XRE-family HTH domain